MGYRGAKSPISVLSTIRHSACPRHRPAAFSARARARSNAASSAIGCRPQPVPAITPGDPPSRGRDPPPTQGVGHQQSCFQLERLFASVPVFRAVGGSAPTTPPASPGADACGSTPHHRAPRAGAGPGHRQGRTRPPAHTRHIRACHRRAPRFHSRPAVHKGPRLTDQTARITWRDGPDLDPVRRSLISRSPTGWPKPGNVFLAATTCRPGSATGSTWPSWARHSAETFWPTLQAWRGGRIPPPLRFTSSKAYRCAGRIFSARLSGLSGPARRGAEPAPGTSAPHLPGPRFDLNQNREGDARQSLAQCRALADAW